MAAPPQQDAPLAAALPSSTPVLPLRPPVRPTLRREWLLLTLAILIFAAVILPPLINLGRYQHRVADTMSRSLGRPVSMRRVTLRLLPTPALVLADVVVHEQPGYGAEPILLAPALTAELRLSSLWRGRFEVSRVEMSDASLNLVRGADGSWNIGSVLLQASHVANAPTSQRRAGPAPRFPYIAITDSRVNLKHGMEKLPYTLLNANISMWLAQPEIWQLKLEAQPVRTDLALGLADTGLLQVEGQLDRAAAAGGGGLGHLPLRLHAEWANAPLGQASRLLLGYDDGWRGELHLAADLSGEVDHLAVQTHLAIANLQREDVASAEPFSVDATCRMLYHRQARRLEDLVCRWPVDAGQLLLRGSVDGAQPGGRQSTFELTADQLPASFLVAAIGLVHSEPAPALRLGGSLAGTLVATAQPGRQPIYTGAIESPLVQLTAPGLEQPLTLSHLRLAPALPGPAGAGALVFSADPLALGGPTPTTVDARFSRLGFLVHAGGSADIARLGELGRATHLLPHALAQLGPEGTLEFDISHAAPWQPGMPIDRPPVSHDGTPSPGRILGISPGISQVEGSGRVSARVTTRRQPHRSAPSPAFTPAMQADGTEGWLRLRSASYSPPFLSGAVSIAAAQATVLPGSISWTVPSAVFHHLPFQASVTYPIACAATQACVPRFHVSFVTLDAGDLTTALLGSDPAARPRAETASAIASHTLADLLSQLGTRTADWPQMTGTVQIDTFTLGHLVLREANATLAFQQQEARFEALQAKTLGGTLTGHGALTMEGRTARFSFDSSLVDASAAAAGSLFHESWGPGAINLDAHLACTGLDTAQLAQSAVGTFRAEWTHGSLGEAAGPLAQFSTWTAAGSIANQALHVNDGSLMGGPGLLSPARPITGSIGFDRVLDLRLGVPTEQVTVTGTISQPRAAPVTQ